MLAFRRLSVRFRTPCLRLFDAITSLFQPWNNIVDYYQIFKERIACQARLKKTFGQSRHAAILYRPRT